MLIWPRSHVIQECLKAICPSLAHCYTSTSVMMEVFVFRISAALFNARPDPPQRVMSFAMSSRFYAEQLMVKAPAALRNSTSQALPDYKASFTAVALAFPYDLMAFSHFSRLDSYPPAKPFTSYVFKLSHQYNYGTIKVVH